jgi:hypothetical protein
MGRRPSPTGTPVEFNGGWEDVSIDKSDALSVAATNLVRTPTPLQRIPRPHIAKINLLLRTT